MGLVKIAKKYKLLSLPQALRQIYIYTLNTEERSSFMHYK